MTYRNLEEFVEAVFKSSIGSNKKGQVCPICGKRTLTLYGGNLEKTKCFHPNYAPQKNRRGK